MINSKRFRRKRSWPNWQTVSEFSWRDWVTLVRVQNDLLGDCQEMKKLKCVMTRTHKRGYKTRRRGNVTLFLSLQNMTVQLYKPHPGCLAWYSPNHFKFIKFTNWVLCILYLYTLYSQTEGRQPGTVIALRSLRCLKSGMSLNLEKQFQDRVKAWRSGFKTCRKWICNYKHKLTGNFEYSDDLSLNIVLYTPVWCIHILQRRVLIKQAAKHKKCLYLFFVTEIS